MRHPSRPTFDCLPAWFAERREGREEGVTPASVSYLLDGREVVAQVLVAALLPVNSCFRWFHTGRRRRGARETTNSRKAIDGLTTCITNNLQRRDLYYPGF